MPDARPPRAGWFAVTRAQIEELLRPRATPEGGTKLILFLCGLLFSWTIVWGALWGYRRAYERFLSEKNVWPVLSPLLPIQRVAMIIGGVLFWLAGLLGFYLFTAYLGWIGSHFDMRNSAVAIGFFFAVLLNVALTIAFLRRFDNWRAPIEEYIEETSRFGTAKFAEPEEVQDLFAPSKGLYIGGGMTYGKQGHLLTVAGTRGGKGVNLIIPNLLGKSDYQGSWVVIDPKGENAAITARYQRGTGRRVLVLDPWRIVKNNATAATYNPLDLLAGANEDDLVDDASVIAEMIVPAGAGGPNRFFSDRARAIVTGMIIHMMLSEDKATQSLTTVWGWLRLAPDNLLNLVGEMAASDNAVVEKTANEILGLSKSQNTFSSVMATALQHTDFLKSPALQQSLAASDFDVKTLSEGKTTLYVVIPADKLKSHYQWLRLVVTTALRSVIRRPDKRVTFLLDEFAALGYLGEIEVALSTYAGYNVTIWAILQNLVQLNDLYGSNWETFLGNTAVKHYFSIGDNFTANYVSTAFGIRTHLGYNDGKLNATPRALITSDELKRASQHSIFCQIEQRAPTYFPKRPYWAMEDLVDNSVQRWDDNPYSKNI